MGFDMLMLALVFMLSAVVLTLMVYRRPSRAHDDTLRAGQGPSLTVAEATLRAGGLTAWMRFGGGGA